MGRQVELGLGPRANLPSSAMKRPLWLHRSNSTPPAMATVENDMENRSGMGGDHNSNLVELIIRDVFYVLVSIGSCTWILNWWTNRIWTKHIIVENVSVENLESLYRRVSGFLKLDMTYLLKPTNVDEYIRSHSFTDRNYFKHVHDNKENVYKFIFFGKINTDRNITTVVYSSKKTMFLEMNLNGKDIKKLKKLFRSDGYDIKTLSKKAHKEEYEELTTNL